MHGSAQQTVSRLKPSLKTACHSDQHHRCISCLLEFIGCQVQFAIINDTNKKSTAGKNW